MSDVVPQPTAQCVPSPSESPPVSLEIDGDRLLRKLVYGKALKRTLTNLLASKASIQHISGRSYKHENGFFKLPIFKNNTLSVRLHFWEAQHRAGSGNIHDHRYSFWSHVLSGELIQRRWLESDTGDHTYRHYHYYPDTDSGHHHLKYAGSSPLTQIETQRLPKGTQYYIAPEILHQTVAREGETTITLLVEDRSRLREYANVYTQEYSKAYVPLQSTIVPPPMCESLLRQALTHI